MIDEHKAAFERMKALKVFDEGQRFSRLSFRCISLPGVADACGGKFYPSRNLVQIEIGACADWASIEAVLVHELTHAYMHAARIRERVHHGPIFCGLRKSAAAETFGIDLDDLEISQEYLRHRQIKAYLEDDAIVRAIRRKFGGSEHARLRKSTAYLETSQVSVEG